MKKDEIIVGQLKIYPNKHKVKSCGNEVTLTNKEFKLLCLLVESKGNVLNRDQLLTNIWGYDFDEVDKNCRCSYSFIKAEAWRMWKAYRDGQRNRLPDRRQRIMKMKQKILNNMVYIAVVAVLITTTLIECLHIIVIWNR